MTTLGVAPHDPALSRLSLLEVPCCPQAGYKKAPAGIERPPLSVHYCVRSMRSLCLPRGLSPPQRFLQQEKTRSRWCRLGAGRRDWCARNVLFKGHSLIHSCKRAASRVHLGSSRIVRSPGWTRTSNLSINSRALCQLSYGGLIGVEA
jgi:hypothetical protein